MKRILVTLLAAGVVFCGSAHAQSKPDAGVAARIRAYLAPFAATGNLTGTVLVARKGQILFEQSYGMANYGWQIPNSSTTRFRIASVSKIFTAAAILQLQEQGRLQVSDSIARYLPDFPNAERITLDSLLTQASGIPDINSLDDYDTFARSPHTLAQLIAKFAGLPLQFAPGSQARYSNSNYILLAMIIEKVSGQSYGDYLATHVFAPCALQATGHDGNASRIISSAASGYEPFELTGYKNAPYIDWSNKTGSGSLYSTAGDLLRFNGALHSGKILSDATRKKYYVEGEDNTYGWYFRTLAGRPVMSGKGRGWGFAAEMDYFPEEGVTIILLSNSQSTVTQDPIPAALAAIVFGKEPPKPPVLSVAPMAQADLASYAGEYQYGADFFSPSQKFTLRPQSGFLVMQRGDAESPLVPAGRDEFIERRFFGSIKIIRDAQGKVTGLVTRYGSRDFTAKKIEPK